MKQNRKTSNQRILASKSFSQVIVDAIGSKLFFYFVLLLFVFQALWVVFSFRFPLVYDEHYHYNLIKIFSDHFSPIITNQPLEYDVFGSVTFGSASLFHYIMSFVYRSITLFTETEIIVIILLRVVNVALAAWGLLMFSKLLQEIGIKRKISNLSLLLFVCIPMVTIVAATINYDNLLFPLTAWFLLLGVRIIKTNKLIFSQLMLFVTVGILASLTKFTFLPVFAGCSLFIFAVVMKRRKKNLLKELKNSFESLSVKRRAVLIGLFVLLSLLFSFRYVYSIVRYATPMPDCKVVLSQERCLSSPVYKWEVDVESTKSERMVDPLEIYIQDWLELIVNGFNLTSSSTTTGTIVGVRSPVIFSSVTVIVMIVGILTLLIMWSRIKKTTSWYLLLVFVVTLTVSTFIFNVLSYYEMHENINVQPRYFLTAGPILIALSITAINTALGKRRRLKIIGLIVMAAVLTQGAGIVTHVVSSEPTWYWQRHKVLRANDFAKRVIRPIVIDR